MERITDRLPDGTAYVRSETGNEGTGFFTTQRRLPEIITRLAAYEDTGLEPEIVKRMNELIEEMVPVMNQFTNLINQGRVMILPCKCGTTVYSFDEIVDIDLCEKCPNFCWGGFGDPHSCGKRETGFRAPECITISEEVATLKNIFWWLHIDAFGKTVFLTREDAEKALEEMKNH